MDYKVIAKKTPGKSDEPEKFYATIVRPKKVTLETLANRISEISPVNQLDTKAVLLALTHVVPEFIVDGATIELGDLGYFVVNISSEGAETENDFKKEMIKKINISYRPSTMVKKAIANVEFRKVG